jgi:hypothetical protein
MANPQFSWEGLQRSLPHDLNRQRMNVWREQQRGASTSSHQAASEWLFPMISISPELTAQRRSLRLGTTEAVGWEWALPENVAMSASAPSVARQFAREDPAQNDHGLLLHHVSARPDQLHAPIF